MNTRNILILASLAAIVTFLEAGGVQTVSADTGSEQDVAVTVYSTADPAGFDPQRFIAQQREGYDPQFAWQVPGFGVVKEVRNVKLVAGTNELRFTDVAQFIDPTTVSFTDLDVPDGTAVLEQNFEFDLVSPEKLMDKYIDREITVVVPKGDTVDEIRGRLLSARQGRLVLQTADGVRVISQHLRAELGDLPGGLITRPTLVWKLQAAEGGEHRVRTTYQTDGITWRSDYNLTLNATDTQADLGAWVTLMNLSGAAYKDARLKLIAGDVQRIQPQPELMRYAGKKGRSMMAMVEDAGFEEKAFFEYHLYTLPRRTDILANTTQQITLFPTARDVDVEKLMVYYGLPQAASWRFFPQPQQDRNFGNQSNPKVDVYVRFQNKKENNLGIPLPKGKVRVYKRDDADGTLEFVGEDLIDHTPKDEKVLIKLGQAFDVVGERTQTDFGIDTSRRTLWESFKIQIRNHKPQAQKVIIKENLYRWTTWEITESSDKYEKIDARTIHFEVNVPPDGEKTVTYRVKYTW
ncbi:MAG: DUF4139 domain-containing protein [Phycisphaerae bacterium]|nr:DUF4139 domain-containing protein [Phycisphaerae bacterium]